MSDHARTEINTPTKAHIMIFFARFVFSSSPLESKYIIPHAITASTAITATYLIIVAITAPIILYTPVSDNETPVLQPGSSQQFISGGAANPTKWERLKSASTIIE